MSRAALGLAALVGVSAVAAACTVNFEGKHFCEPHCPGTGGSGGGGGTTETLSSAGGGGTGGNGGATNQGGGGGCGGKAVTPANDEFSLKDKPPAAFWTQLFPDRSSPKMVELSDALLITPTPQATWYTGPDACPGDGCGAPAIVQRVSGNFAMKTHVTVKLTSGNIDPFAAAGILLAAPCDAAKNHVVWDVGYQDQASIGTELYQTIDGAPAVQEGHPAAALDVDLYACRLDDKFFFWVSSVGVSPNPASPDATLTWSTGDLDVGLTAHVNGQQQVIEGQFHSVSFALAEIQDDCTSRP